MRIIANLCLLLAIMAPSITAAETLSEALDRMEAQAEIDREQVPLFAITAERLKTNSDELFGMPTDVIKAARRVGGSMTFVRVGESSLKIEGKNGIVTFTMYLSVQSAPDARGSVLASNRDNPIEKLIGWVHGMHTSGIVFEKKKEGTVKVVPNFMTCNGITFGGRLPYNTEEACERFGFGSPSRLRIWKTPEDRKSEDQFLMYLMAHYGEKGVLTRASLTQALEAHNDRVSAVIKASEEKTGYVRYNHYAGDYSTVKGHLLRANVLSRAYSIRPDGRVEIAVHVYSERVAGVEVELQYEDGSPVAPTTIGNLAKATIARSNLVPSETGLSGFEIIKVQLPSGLKPGKLRIMANAVGNDGRRLVRDEEIGTFEYAVKSPDKK